MIDRWHLDLALLSAILGALGAVAARVARRPRGAAVLAATGGVIAWTIDSGRVREPVLVVAASAALAAATVRTGPRRVALGLAGVAAAVAATAGAPAVARAPVGIAALVVAARAHGGEEPARLGGRAVLGVGLPSALWLCTPDTEAPLALAVSLAAAALVGVVGPPRDVLWRPAHVVALWAGATGLAGSARGAAVLWVGLAALATSEPRPSRGFGEAHAWGLDVAAAAGSVGVAALAARSIGLDPTARWPEAIPWALAAALPQLIASGLRSRRGPEEDGARSRPPGRLGGAP